MQETAFTASQTISTSPAVKASEAAVSADPKAENDSGSAASNNSPTVRQELKRGNTYRADIVFAAPIAQNDILWRLESPSGLVQRRKLSENDQSKFVLFTMPDDQTELSAFFRDGSGNSVNIPLESLNIIPIEFNAKKRLFSFSDASVVACIASYPARKGMLSQTITSLIDQVDHICVYLNSYMDIPDYIQSGVEAGKITYVVSSENDLRAAGKFYWFGNKGYFLFCDDDIIYPPDYAAVMLDNLNGLDRSQNILGLLSRRLEKSGRKTIVAEAKHFWQMQENVQRCHYLGTGVLAAHSSALARMSRDRLLSEPINNDDIFALEAQRCGLRLWSGPRPQHWVKSNPQMSFGLYEEVYLDSNKRSHRQELLDSVPVWPKFDQEPLTKFLPNADIQELFQTAVAKLVAVRNASAGIGPRFVQIGACDGKKYDPLHTLVMTHQLAGIFFEPLPHLFAKLQDTYSDCSGLLFINAAITESGGSADMRFVAPDAISDNQVPEWAIGIGSLMHNVNALDGAGGISPDVAAAIARNIISTRVQTIAFDEVARWEPLAMADIFVSDAEGYDTYFLDRISSGILRPKILLSETLLLDKEKITEIRENLIVCGYDVYCGEEDIFATLL